ncbi:MAG: molybdopterin-dependent oxidoreductase [Thermomicrobiales bacterium]|nr:molybdopterin-dependent oxidoreductase [Thermomicrobiales bacterium]
MIARPRKVRKPVIDDHAGRLPPGQIAAKRWPALHKGEVPPFDPETWEFRVWGLVGRELRLSWETFQALPRVTADGDLHCVARWSKLDNCWDGAPGRELLRLTEPSPAARFVIMHAEGGYTANVPMETFAEEGVLLAVGLDGEPLTPKHGAPVRAVLPRLYAWKSVKWLRGLELTAEDRPGFWENYGYHNDADAWKEERFADGDPGRA